MLRDGEDVTIDRAAEILGVTTDQLASLLAAGQVRYADGLGLVDAISLFLYRDRRDSEREMALDSLARDAFELGLYDRTRIPEGGEDA